MNQSSPERFKPDFYYFNREVNKHNNSVQFVKVRQGDAAALCKCLLSITGNQCKLS